MTMEHKGFEWNLWFVQNVELKIEWKYVHVTSNRRYHFGANPIKKFCLKGLNLSYTLGYRYRAKLFISILFVIGPFLALRERFSPTL